MLFIKECWEVSMAYEEKDFVGMGHIYSKSIKIEGKVYKRHTTEDINSHVLVANNGGREYLGGKGVFADYFIYFESDEKKEDATT